MVDDQVNDDLQPPLVRLVEQSFEIFHSPVIRMDADKIGDIIAIVL